MALVWGRGMSVKSNQYTDATLTLVALLAVLSAAASFWDNQGMAITLSVLIALLCVGVLWERRSSP